MTSRQIEIKQRAIAWTNEMYQYELDCEMNNGLTADQHAKVRQLVINHGLAAITVDSNDRTR